VLERIDTTRDLHFYTRTTIDTLDYSGTGLNAGSKVAIAAAGERRRELAGEAPAGLSLPAQFADARLAMPGVLAVQAPAWTGDEQTARDVGALDDALRSADLAGVPLIVLCDDAAFTARTISNFVWVTFTRSNPSHDIHGVDSFTEHKHWGCRGPIIIDARTKAHHAPPLEKDPAVEQRVDRLGERGGPLHGII
jgi:4-hydroxy-3-polyprenylbenzoate decarboxylase